MSVASVLASGRRAALARMTSTATVRRPTGRTTQDEATGREVPVWAVVHTDVPFQYAGSSNGDGGTRRVEVGGVEFQQATGVGKFAHDLTDLADGDHVEITAGEWAGTVLSVVEAVKKDQATARRVPVVEVDRPEEWA